MRFRRLILSMLLAAAVAPGLWWHDPPRWNRPNNFQDLRLEPLEASAPGDWPKGLGVLGAWRLVSRNNRFGGYSALLADRDGTLTAISDFGQSLQFRRPDLPGAAKPRFGRIELHNTDWSTLDIEAATSDPKTGTRWLAYEKLNQIRRSAKGSTVGVVVAPPAMRNWPENGGAESMVRLADGRFIVLAEDAPWLSMGGRPGLLFPSDPVDGTRPLEFMFRPPIGYSPSDMAALPDGRVVILLRAFDPPLPPFFSTMLVVADPAAIGAGKGWPWQKLADLADPLPRDNYEGLAIMPDATGVTMWLISDDNRMRYQRTLLLQLHWQVPPPSAAAGRP